MDIVSVAYQTPSLKISNEDILDHIDAENKDLSPVKRAAYKRLVSSLFKHTGAETRFWRDLKGGEKAHDHISSAMKNALSEADMKANDIDLLIYCGVGRGFLEPANAYFFANSLQMEKAECFDITDACMSWIRAMHHAYLLLNSGTHKNIMIINGEFHFGIHDNWKIDQLRSLDYTFPMYTIGEAATATIVTASDKPWKFSFNSRPEFANLCTIPLQEHDNFFPDDDRIGLNGICTLTSFGRPLLEEGEAHLRKLLEDTIADMESKDMYFPHAPSEKVYSEGLPKVGIPNSKTWLGIYRNFGNLVSASIPVGLRTACDSGNLNRGDKIALIPVSAGLVASVVELEY